MKCTKCGFISFDYLEKCRKCGADLAAVREELHLWEAPAKIPDFVAEAIETLALSSSAGMKEAVPMESEEVPTDVIDEIDLSIETPEGDSEITLELLDDDTEELDLGAGGLPEEGTEPELTSDSEESGSDELVLDMAALEGEPSHDSDLEVDLSLPEEEPLDEAEAIVLPTEPEEEVYELDEPEELDEQSLEKLREELESVDELMLQIESEPEESPEPETSSEELILDLGGEEEPTLTLDQESPSDDSTVVVVEEESEGIAVQEFILEEAEEEEGPEDAGSEDAGSVEERIKLDLSVFEEEEEEPVAQGKSETGDQEDQEPLEGLILELEDGLILEPDDEEENEDEEKK